MNAKGGLRRVGLLLGVLGALAGSVGSLIYLADLLEDRAHAKRFQGLARTYWQVVQQTPSNGLGPGWENYKLDQPITPGEKSSISSQLPVPKLGPTPPKGFENYQDIPYSQVQQLLREGGAVQDAAHKEALRRNGIEGHYLDSEGKISGITLTDGTTLYTATEPVWSYLLLPFFPVLGFIIPWGAIRVVSWVACGFFQGG